MARIRKKATQRTILLRERVVLRYLFTSEVGWATKRTLIRKVFKYNRPWKLYERKLHFLHILQETVILWLVAMQVVVLFTFGVLGTATFISTCTLLAVGASLDAILACNIKCRHGKTHALLQHSTALISGLFLSRGLFCPV